ncbi:hypothetical protein KSP40_PGU005316 [Platanthera guangdongensis]|uniref:Uncharacterized protein n=1 Tax=Platanthera guangdongensis TaxID=2320717 RepID=A0ABR2N197_9ASPA
MGGSGDQPPTSTARLFKFYHCRPELGTRKKIKSQYMNKRVRTESPKLNSRRRKGPEQRMAQSINGHPVERKVGLAQHWPGWDGQMGMRPLLFHQFFFMGFFYFPLFFLIFFYFG